MTLAPSEPKHSLDQELIQTYQLRRRQPDVSFNLSLVITAASALVSIVGAAQLLLGNIPAGTITASSGAVASACCFRFAKDANDRLDKLATELKDE
jgi:hypothetical protein